MTSTPHQAAGAGDRHETTWERGGGRPLTPSHVAAQPVVRRGGKHRISPMGSKPSEKDDTVWVMADNGVISSPPVG